MLRSKKAQRRVAAASEQVGAYSSHYKCDNGISLAILFTTLAGISSLFFVLFTRITMYAGGRRRKRSSSAVEYDLDAWDKVDEGIGLFDADIVSDIIFTGMLISITFQRGREGGHYLNRYVNLRWKEEEKEVTLIKWKRRPLLEMGIFYLWCGSK